MTTKVIGGNVGNDYTGLLCTQITQNFPTFSFGDETAVPVDKAVAAQWNNGIFIITGLSNITGPVTVSSATLSLYVSVISSPQTHTLKTLLRTVVIGSLGSNDLTWTDAQSGLAWTTGGALSDGNDRNATAAGSNSISATGYSNFTSAQLATDVQNAINNSLQLAFVLERTDSSNDTNTATIVGTANGTNGILPYLTVTYTAGGGSATPYPTQLYVMP